MPQPYEIVFSDVLLTTIQDDDVRVNIGELADGVGVSSASPMFGNGGFISVPLNPDASGCAQVGYVQNGDEKIVICHKDGRLRARFGNLVPGDQLVVTESAARVVVKNVTASAALYTTNDGTDTGRPIYTWVHPEKGWEVVTPWGYASLGPLGFHAEHFPSGTELHMGAASGIPGLEALGGYAQISAGNGMLSLKGSIVNIGSGVDGGAAHTLAVEALRAHLALEATMLTALAALLLKATPASGLTDPEKTAALALLADVATSATALAATGLNSLGQIV